METNLGELGRSGHSPVILIPVYQPEAHLVGLVRALRARFNRIVLVDDGSTRGRCFFDEVAPFVEKILVHPVNRGKGAALKTGLSFIGEAAVVTADADGQHTPDDIARVADALMRSPNGLILGTRTFHGRVPFRSRFGNAFTRLIFRLAGVRVTDTQSGLRGIPASLIRAVAAIPGDHYEFELLMLLETRHNAAPLVSVPIETVYLDGNRTSHFRPLTDSVRNNFALFRRILHMI